MNKRINPLELNTNEQSPQYNESVVATNTEEVKATSENCSEKWYVKVWNAIKNAVVVAATATVKFFVKLYNIVAPFCVKIFTIVKDFFVNLFKKIKNKLSKEKTVEEKENE